MEMKHPIHHPFRLIQMLQPVSFFMLNLFFDFIGSYSYPNFANAVSQQVESNEESLDDKIQALKAKEEARNKMREVNLMAATAKAMVNSASTSSPNIATPELVDNSNSVYSTNLMPSSFIILGQKIVCLQAVAAPGLRWIPSKA